MFLKDFYRFLTHQRWYVTSFNSLGFLTIMAPVIPANNMGPQKVIPVILDDPTWRPPLPSIPVEKGNEGICGAAAAPRNALELLDDFGSFA